MKKVLIGIILTAISLQARVVSANEEICTNDKRVNGPCYTIKGSLVIAADMLPRLISFKTGEMIRIALSIDEYNGNFMWPDALNKLIKLDTNVDGSFHVCPVKFTREKDSLWPAMKTVCIAGAANLHTEPSGN